jgi:HlyD family secretion protein
MVTMSRRSLKFYAIAVVLAVLAAGVYFFHDESTSKPQYQLASVDRGTIVSTVAASGTIRPDATITVFAQAQGQAVEVLAADKTDVKAGEVLARLNSDSVVTRVDMAKADAEAADALVTVARAQVEHARLEVDNAQAAVEVARADVGRATLSLSDASRDLKRTQELAKTGDAATVESERARSSYGAAGSDVASVKAKLAAAQSAQAAAQAEADVAEAQLKSALATAASRQAAMRQAKLDLDHTSIRAPIDGTVIARNVSVGQVVTVGGQQTPLFTLASDLHHMQVHTSVDEADVGRIAAGQPATFVFDAFPDQTFTGTVLEVRPMPQENQTVVSYDTVIAAENPDLKLLPGMTAEVRIETARRDNVLKVANAALRFRPASVESERGVADAHSGVGSPSQVWIVGPNGAPKAVPIGTGITDGIDTEVVSGDLAAGESVIVASTEPADTGTQIGPLKF